MTARQLIENESGDGKRWIKCVGGWISYKRLSSGRYYVTASRQQAISVEPSDLHSILRELTQQLGGRARA